MGKIFKALIVYFLYKIEIKDCGKSRITDNVRFRFKMIPKKILVGITFIVFTPVLIVLNGIYSLKETFIDSMESRSWTSFEIYLPEGQKPSKWDCCKKYSRIN